jgi:hypothetical protein
MKIAAVPRLYEITFFHERTDRSNYCSPADTQELGYAIQRGVALTGFAVEVVGYGGRHAHLRTGQVVCEADCFVSDECVRWSGSHVVLPMSLRNDPHNQSKRKLLFMFALPVANWRKLQRTKSSDSDPAQRG